MADSARAAKLKILTYKGVFYGALLFILGVLQVTFFSRINLFNATPDLLLGAVIVISMYEDHKVTTICSILSGFVYCSLGGFSYPLYLIFSFLCGYILWSLSEHTFGKNYLSFLALAAITYGAKVMFNIFEPSLTSSSFNLWVVLFDSVIPEYFSSLIFCSISYLIFAFSTRIMNKKRKSRRI